MHKAAVVLAALTLALGGVAVQPSKAAGAVVGDWQYNPATGHWYGETVPMIWLDAEMYAHTVGGNLVTINDQAEQDWLMGVFSDPNLLIGFSDQWNEGYWGWSSGQQVIYTNWAAGEPNNYGSGEDVAVMNWVDNDGVDYGGAWNDLHPNSFTKALVEVERNPAHQNKGAATQFMMSYPGPTTFTCAGVRVANKVSVKDNETCLVTGDTSAVVVGTINDNGGAVTWYSEYDGSPSTQWTMTTVSNGDGTFTAYIQAYY